MLLQSLEVNVTLPLAFPLYRFPAPKYHWSQESHWVHLGEMGLCSLPLLHLKAACAVFAAYLGVDSNCIVLCFSSEKQVVVMITGR